jgi:hypothetical protein
MMTKKRKKKTQNLKKTVCLCFALVVQIGAKLVASLLHRKIYHHHLPFLRLPRRSADIDERKRPRRTRRMKFIETRNKRERKQSKIEKDE